jgi:hypothetical protein
MRNNRNEQWVGRRNAGHNPHSKFNESDGPDVKVSGDGFQYRGKMPTARRDAHTSVIWSPPKPVTEHYYRLLAEQEQSRDQ